MAVRAATLRREIASMLELAGYDPREAKVTIGPPHLEAEHRRDRRRYAEVLVGPAVMHFSFARATLDLPDAHRLGLVAHEVGHVIAIDRWGDSSEPGADRAAREVLGIRIGYDKRWPGKGLQYARG